MKRTVHQAQNDALNRMGVAIERVSQRESKEDKERANQWARAWQKKYLKLSWVFQADKNIPNRD